MASLARVKDGDVVKCDVKGRVFFAEVKDGPHPKGKKLIRPIDRNISYTTVTALQVKSIYRKLKDSAPNSRSSGDDVEHELAPSGTYGGVR